MTPAVADHSAPSPIAGSHPPPTRLRRFDWRFLLPRPRGGGGNGVGRMVVLGGRAPEELEALRRLGVGEDVSGDLTGRPADVVAILCDAKRHSWEAALQAVAPGGILYCEVDRLTPAGRWISPRRLAARLRAAGLTPVASYWLVPNCEATTRFIPLDSTLAIEWYLGTLYRRHTRLRSVLGRAALLLARWGLLSSCVRAFGMVGAREGGGRTPYPLTDPRPGVETDAPGFCTALLTSGQDDASRIVFVPFSERGVSSPVVKLARLPQSNELTDREFDTLATLRTRLDPALSATIPEPLWRGRMDGLSVIAETYAPGPTLLASTSAIGASTEDRIEDFRRAASWLTAFHSQCVLERTRWTDVEVRRWVQQPLGRFTQAFDDVRTDLTLVELVGRLNGLAEDLAGQDIPIVVQHNDFGPWNVHRERDRLTVVDWEFGAEGPDGRAGLPLEDLVYFATHWWLAARRFVTDRGQQKGFAELLASPVASADPMVRAVRVEFSAYLRALRIDPRFRGLAIPMTWIRRATAHAARSGPASAACQRHLGFLRTLARNPDGLFGEHV